MRSVNFPPGGALHQLSIDVEAKNIVFCKFSLCVGKDRTLVGESTAREILFYGDKSEIIETITKMVNETITKTGNETSFFVVNSC
jgi:hypothetical protein